jgi:hypothetical protein
MNSPEFTVIGINVIFVLVSYFYIYPSRTNVTAMVLARYDLVLNGMAIGIAGALFWGTQTRFDAVVVELNWFWFTLLTYALLEVPIMLWYFNKHHLWATLR